MNAKHFKGDESWIWQRWSGLLRQKAIRFVDFSELLSHDCVHLFFSEP